MIDLGMENGEYYLREFRGAQRRAETFTGYELGDLYLTSRNLIFAKLNRIGRVKKLVKFPLNTIKDSEEGLRIWMSSTASTPDLEVEFESGLECFCLMAPKVDKVKAETEVWVDAIKDAAAKLPRPKPQPAMESSPSGLPEVMSVETRITALAELKKLLDDGVVSPEEFEDLKAEIIARSGAAQDSDATE